MDDLVASMAILSNSFLMTDDLVSSVRENTERLPLPEPFRAFLTYVECIDGNVAAGLHRLGRHVDNLYFSEWVDVLILAQEDRSMKYAALPVVEMLHDLRQAQGEADTVMYGIWYEYLTVLALIFCAPLVLRLLMPDAYGILVTSPVGKALLFALIAAVVYSLLRAAALNKPLVS